jgi:hypothetical protein
LCELDPVELVSDVIWRQNDSERTMLKVPTLALIWTMLTRASGSQTGPAVSEVADVGCIVYDG